MKTAFTFEKEVAMKRLARTLGLFLIMMLITSTADLYGQWVQQPFPTTNETLWSVRFVNETTGWVLGGLGHIYKTTDGGTTWVTQETWQGGGWGLHALSENKVLYGRWLTGQSNSSHMRMTTDGGSTWQTVDSLGLGSVFYDDFEFIEPQTGFVAGSIDSGDGSKAIVRKTTDGGSTWTTIWTENIRYGLEGISFVDALNGWVCAYLDKVLRTTDGGSTWTEVTSFAPPSGGSTRDIQFTTSDSGWAVGGIAGNLTVSRTTDGGLSWSYFTSFNGSSLREITMLNSQLGWFVGSVNSEPYVARTTNGGETWETQATIPPTNFGFESISVVNDTTGWLVGAFGQLYKTTNGGIVSVEEGPREGIPSSFILEQNYPNPFNPSTVIKYGVPHEAHVSLKLYDVLGREVMTLVDGLVRAGFHEVSLDASGLSSGVYYYRLQARLSSPSVGEQAADPSSRSARSGRNFIETKKLVLLR